MNTIKKLNRTLTRQTYQMRNKIINILAVVLSVLFVAVFIFTKFHSFSKPSTNFDVTVRILNFFCYGICPLPLIFASLSKIELKKWAYPLFITFTYCLFFLGVYNVCLLGSTDVEFREALQSDVFNVLCSLSVVLCYIISYIIILNYECNKKE